MLLGTRACLNFGKMERRVSIDGSPQFHPTSHHHPRQTTHHSTNPARPVATHNDQAFVVVVVLSTLLAPAAASSSSMFGVTVKRSAFVGETTQQQQHAAAGAGPAKRTLQPMVTGTSVLGVKVSLGGRERGGRRAGRVGIVSSYHGSDHSRARSPTRRPNPHTNSTRAA